MRALAYHHYLGLRESIQLLEVKFMHQLPSEMHFIMFDYRSPAGVEFVAQRVALVDTTREPFRTQWADHVARAKRSPGRMLLGLMVVLEGTKVRDHAISIHFTNSVVYDGLRALAAAIPAGADLEVMEPQLLQRIREINERERVHRMGDEISPL